MDIYSFIMFSITFLLIVFAWAVKNGDKERKINYDKP